MIVERTHYYAKAGMADRVLATRRRACAVRRAIGLAVGDIFAKSGGAAGDPDVTWECRFTDAAAHEADLAARAASADFGAVRAEMTSLIDKFERHIVKGVDASLPSGMRHTSLDGYPVAPREIAFASGGFKLKGYLHLPPGEGPFPCIITNHGSTIEKGTEDVSRPGTAALLMSWGIASFLPHRRGYGNSEGPAWREEASAPYGTTEYDDQLSGRLDRESDDIIAALDIVAKLPEIKADHIGVMGSSFGGTTTLLAASKSNRFTCAIDFAGAAMNWDRTPALRDLMTNAAKKVMMPIFFIQAANDYSIRPTQELPPALDGLDKIVQSKIYPVFGINHLEAHLLESRGPTIWADDVKLFLERYL